MLEEETAGLVCTDDFLFSVLDGEGAASPPELFSVSVHTALQAVDFSDSVYPDGAEQEALEGRVSWITVRRLTMSVFLPPSSL